MFDRASSNEGTGRTETGPSFYEVKKGDTLWNIARQELKAAGVENPSQHAIKLELLEIIDSNKSDAPHLASSVEHISPGMQLKLPTATRELQSLSTVEPMPYYSVPADQVHLSHVNHKHAHNYLHGLHSLEKKILSVGKEVIDDVDHWLMKTAANAFLLARKEAEEHGVYIHINSAGRTYGQQARLYHQLHGHSPVARPGTSNHETGLAVDVENWRQARPYLEAHGFVHGDGSGPIRNDMWHFKYVGQKETATKSA